MLFSRKQNEIRNKKTIFLMIPFLSVVALGIINIPNFWCLLFLRLLLLIIISAIVTLTYVREKLIYDDLGITICDIRNHKYQVLWEDVLVKDTYEDPRYCRGAPGRIVKIIYKNHKGKTETVKYDYSTYDGLYEFVTFYYAKKGIPSLKNANSEMKG